MILGLFKVFYNLLRKYIWYSLPCNCFARQFDFITILIFPQHLVPCHSPRFPTWPFTIYSSLLNINASIWGHKKKLQVKIPCISHVNYLNLIFSSMMILRYGNAYVWARRYFDKSNISNHLYKSQYGRQNIYYLP